MTYLQSAIRFPHFFALGAAICVVQCGCGAQEVIPVEDHVAESVVAKTQAETTSSVKETSADGAPADETRDQEEVEKDRPLASDTFEPPFPDRVKLFVAPKRRGHRTKNSPESFENSVELLGFVHVDQRRVVLSIDGLVSPLAEGSHQAGIEVISIQPPSVVLQRGRQRWQVNLEY